MTSLTRRRGSTGPTRLARTVDHSDIRGSSTAQLHFRRWGGGYVPITLEAKPLDDRDRRRVLLSLAMVSCEYSYSGTGATMGREAIFDGNQDPLALACLWQEEAWKTEPSDANAAALATAGADGAPNVRMVLVKAISSGTGGGFVFYTNLESVKGREIAENSVAALVLHWKSRGRQLRARGPLVPVSDAEADAYFLSRPLESRIGAWASRQSRPLVSRAALMEEVVRITARYPGGPRRPPHWSGFRMRPREIEFWMNGRFRLHDRVRWTRSAVDSSEWSLTRLQP